jgi:putative membrane protein
MLRGLGQVAAQAQERAYEWGRGMHPMWGVWGAWGVAMAVMMLLFWGVVIVGIVLGIRWLVSQGREPQRDTAMDILRQRYARGEITREEFDSMPKRLASAWVLLRSPMRFPADEASPGSHTERRCADSLDWVNDAQLQPTLTIGGTERCRQ